MTQPGPKLLAQMRSERRHHERERRQHCARPLRLRRHRVDKIENRGNGCIKLHRLDIFGNAPDHFVKRTERFFIRRIITHGFAERSRDLINVEPPDALAELVKPGHVARGRCGAVTHGY